MQRYDSYKPSGIYFLPDLPKHWKTRKAKYLFKEENRPVRPDDEIVTCFRDGQVTLRKNRRTEGFTNSLKEIGYQGVRKGDLVIHNMDAFAGAIGISDSDGKATPVYACCTPKTLEVNQYYYCYLLRYLARNGFILSLAKGIRERSTDFRFNDFKELYLPIPSREEQDAIVKHIDTVTAKIDAAIAQQQKMIDLLNERKQIIINRAVTRGLNPNARMKDSGVEWIGEVPEGWDIIPLKAIISFVNGYAFDSNDFKDEGDVRVIRISNIADGTIDYEGIAFVRQNQSLCSYLTKAGDLLIAMSGATTGKVGFDNIGGAYVNQRVGIIRSDFQKWVYYWLNTSCFKEYIYLSALGSAQPNISSKGIKNFRILFPLIEDYERIIENLELLCQKVDDAIGSCKNQISLLQERKQIIINEVVTGKVRVM